ncbi:DHHC palmitoyltransferase-domain-containing protein [Scheffersomyces coipomensis]|uniref:DHHC palmitoyltransferase-domain-containing protein n=1 Tax=Scheffersomyces coipomensis TaxID=1788519 RepID=UPI00315D2AFC
MLISQPMIMLKQRPSWLLSTERFCCFLASLFPKVFFTSLSLWSLYVLIFVVNEEYINQEYHKPTLAIISSIFGVLLCALSVYTYYKVIWIGAGSPLDFDMLHLSNPSPQYLSSNPFDVVPPESSQPLLDNDDIENHHNNRQNDIFPPEPPSQYISFHTFSSSKPVRYCNKCQVWKPDRTHHCSSSNKCILRMDHYCPWFSTCIGFRNQKFFIQFLGYLATYSFYLFISSFAVLYVFFIEEQYTNGFISVSLIILFVLSLSFSLALGVFFLFSVYLLLQNLTTIEFQDQRWAKHESNSFLYEFDPRGKKQKLGHIYDLGYKKNWTSIMGDNWVHWILPIASTSNSITDKYNNGVNFEIDEPVYEKWTKNLQLQEQLNQQLADYKNRLRTEREAGNIV